MPIETVQVGHAGEGEGLTVTLRGDTPDIVRVLVQGLPRDALQQLHDAIQAELQTRATTPEEP